MIRNITRGTVLCDTHEVAGTAWQKTTGLMFRKELPEGRGLLMTFSGDSSPGIWMLCMRFPIDIVFLDSGRRVIRVVENARPLGLSWRTWRIFFPPGPAKFVLELPAGRAGKSKTRTGDKLEFQHAAGNVPH